MTNRPPANFARNPADALQCLADLRRTTQHVLDRARVDKAWREEIKGTTLGFLLDFDKGRNWAAMIGGVPVYFWSEKTAAIVSQAAHTYPLDTTEVLNEDRAERELARINQGLAVEPPTALPTLGAGLAVFERPLLFVDINGSRVPLSALLWRVGVWKDQKQITLLIRGIEWFSSFASPCFWIDAPLGEQQAPVLTDPNNTLRSEHIALTKWICTASMFVQQHILVTSPTHVGKHVSRRIPDHEPTCHVVSLRKTLHTDQPLVAGESDIEWACRWLVRGHWRNQYFPSKGTRAPIWIHPHVKGPEDKPFKEVLPTVYGVTR